MKKTLAPILLLLLLLTVLGNQAFAKTADNVFIDGYIADFGKLDKAVYLDKTISVEYYNAIGESQRVTGNFDKQGKFKLSFHLLNPQDIIIQSGAGDYTMTLVKPGEAVHLVVRYYKIDQASQHYPNLHYRTDFKDAFSGPNAMRYASVWGFYTNAGKLGLLKVDSTIVRGGVDLLNSKLAKLPGIVKENFTTADSITTEWLINLIASEHTYNFIIQSHDKHLEVDYSKINYVKSTAQNWRFFSMVKNINVPQTIDNNFRRTAVLKNPNLKFTETDVQLLDKIFAGNASAADSLKLGDIGEQFKSNPKATESADSIYCILVSDYYAKNYPSFIADIKNGELVKDYHVAAFFNPLRPKLFESISPEMQNYLSAEILADNKLNKNITYTKSTEADVVKMLIAKFPGQNLYVDLWATWCGPCRAEFPYYPEVMDKYKGKVTFVFLCGASEEKAYKAVLSNLNFKANHFFLNNDQYANYKNTFGITGIPHYLFITKDGKITNNFKRPSAHLDLYADIDAEITK